MTLEQSAGGYVPSPVTGMAEGLGIEKMKKGDSVLLGGVFRRSHKLAVAARHAAYTRLFITKFTLTDEGLLMTRV